jgi:hypothetical protein
VCGCTPSPTPPRAAAQASADTCVRATKRNQQAFANALFRSEYLYACRLEQAFDDYVKPRRGCSRDDDCTFMAGACGIHRVALNKAFERKVTEIRNRVVAAHDEVVACSACGSGGEPAPPRCVLSQCE